LTLKRLLDESRVRDIECYLLTPEECKEKCPLIRIDDLEGGIWMPQDGIVSSNDLLNVFIDECKKNDIFIVENCEVTKVITKATRGGHYSKVSAVETTHGLIECDYFVNCAGIRARELGKLSKPRVKIPIHACEHHYLITKPYDVPKNLPIVRDYDGSIYIRQYEGGILFGGFEKEAKPVFHESIPDNFEFQTMQPDLDHFCKSQNLGQNHIFLFFC
jgi:pyruvate dehydrogenase phosphatase regulatory subunit